MMNKQHGKVCPKIDRKQVEIWKPVVGYEGLYEVSSVGRIKSLKYGKERILKQTPCSVGYLRVNLYNDRKVKLGWTHRLMVRAFFGPIEGLEIDHINGVKTDNRLENLRAVTRAENTRSYHTPRGGTSQYRGVYLSNYKNLRKRWCSRVRFDGIKYHIGYFETETEAALAWNRKALELGFNKEALNIISL